MAKERRCNLFEDNGRPRRLKDGTRGCFRDASDCRFAHPHERDWETAVSSPPPRRDILVCDSEFSSHAHYKERRDRDRDDGDRDRHKKRELDRKPSSLFHGNRSPPHRKDSTITQSSLDSSSRKSVIDTTIKRGSPALSDLQRKDSPLVGRGRTPSSHSAQSPLVPNHIPDTLVQHPPPPMQPAPPPPPLPEVPSLPSFAAAQQPAGPAGTALRGLSMEEQRSAWHERIDLMFASIASRRDYAKLEADVTQIRLLSASSLVNGMSEADRAKITAQRTELELQMEAKRKEINETVQKLIGSDFWPVLRTPQISEMEKALGETKKHVLEVRSVLDDVKNSCTALFKTSAPDWAPDSERPSKRRRLEGTADAPAQSTNADAEDMAESTAKEVEVFRDKLAVLDRELVDLENDITQRDNIISDEIELHIEARLEAEDVLYPLVKEPTGISQAEIEAVVDAKNKELVRAVTVTGEEIGVLAVEVAELITKVDALETRCRVLEAENREFKSKLAQDTIDHARSQDALLRRDKEIEAVAAALEAYISQAPAGQTAGDLPSAEYIIESLDGQLDGFFREKFCPTLVNLQKDMFDKVQESQSRTLNTVSPKIMLLLKMVNLITARLGKADVETGSTG